MSCVMENEVQRIPKATKYHQYVQHSSNGKFQCDIFKNNFKIFKAHDMSQGFPGYVPLPTDPPFSRHRSRPEAELLLAFIETC